MFQKLAVIILMLSMLTGCYDNRETDTLATVMAVGVEQGEDGKKYTFAVADTGGYSGDSKGDSAALICFTQTGKTVDAAVDALDRKLSKKLSFSHLSALIFSASAAQSDMYSEVSYFEKKISVRPQTMIAVSEISPKDYLDNLKPNLEVNPEKYFQNVLSRNESYVSTLRLCDFTNAYHEGATTSAPLIKGKEETKKLTEEDTFISGSALIVDGKMTEVMKDNWVVGLIHTKKSVKYSGISCKSVENADIEVNTRKSKPKININLKVKADKKIDVDKLEKKAESILREYGARGLDIADAASHAKRGFLLQNKYDSYGFDVKNADFNVDVQLLAKEDEDDI